MLTTSGRELVNGREIYAKRNPAKLVRSSDLANDLASNQRLHDLCGAIADLETNHVAHPLLMGQIETEAEMAVE